MASEAIAGFSIRASEAVRQGARVLVLFLAPNIDEPLPFCAVRERVRERLAPQRREPLCRPLASEALLVLQSELDHPGALDNRTGAGRAAEVYPGSPSDASRHSRFVNPQQCLS